MRRLAVLTVAATVLGGVGATSCGVLADDDAAVVGGVGVPAATVDAMTRDKAFSELLGYDPADNKSVLPGSSARTALEFAVQTQTLENLARRFGVEPDEDTKALDEQLGQTRNPITSSQLSPEARVMAARYVGTLNAMADRFSKLKDPSDADLRLLYDSAPSRWQQVCVSAVAVPTSDVARARRALAGGVKLADLPDKVKSARAAADPRQGCLTTNVVPPELGREFEMAPVGRLRGPVEVSLQGQTVSVWYRVTSRKVVSFRSARSELKSLASDMAQQGPFGWLPFVTADITTVNPRYGSGIELTQGRDAQGRTTVQATIAAPATPASPAGVSDASTAAGGSSDSSGSGSGATP